MPFIRSTTLSTPFQFLSSFSSDLSYCFYLCLDYIKRLFSLMTALLNPGREISEQNIQLLEEILFLYLPWFMLVAMIRFFYKLVANSKKRKVSAFIFGAFIQMFMPDPYAERTVKTVQVRTSKQSERKEDNTGEKLDME